MEKILLTFMICLSVLSGDEFFCHKLQQGRCHNPNPISSYVTQLNWIENKIATENQLIRQEQKRLAARIRFLRFDKDHMDKEWIQQEYETIKFYFKVLVEINKMIEQTNKNVTVLVISDEDLEVVRDFKKKEQLTYLMGSDPSSSIISAFGLELSDAEYNRPAVFLIDKDQIIRMAHYEKRTPKVFKKVEEAL